MADKYNEKLFDVTMDELLTELRNRCKAMVLVYIPLNNEETSFYATRGPYSTLFGLSRILDMTIQRDYDSEKGIIFTKDDDEDEDEKE